jgi:hypothetical protein
MRFLQKRSMVAVVLVVLFVLLLTSSVFAQQREIRRTWGLSGSVQNGQTAILIPLWLGDTMILAPGFNVNYTENVGTTVGVMLVPRFYLDMGRIVPYIPLIVGVLLDRPSNNAPNTSNLMLGVGLGGEYFINPKFSFAVEARLDGQVVDLSGLNNIALQTVTAIIANIYF